MDVIVFERVTRKFRTGRSVTLKDTILRARKAGGNAATTEALADVSFVVRAGESVALLGHNGSGKSTVLKLASGIMIPSSGSVKTTGRIAPLLELGAGFHPDLTGRENIYLNAAILRVPRSYIKRHLDEIIDFSGIGDFIDSPVRTYSSGMVTRLGFSISVHVEPEIILLDEVLSVGDAGFQERSLERMKFLLDEGRTMLVATHSLKQAQAFTRRALVLEGGHIIYDGQSSLAFEAFAESTGGSTVN